jgi:hypothetical protein
MMMLSSRALFAYMTPIPILYINLRFLRIMHLNVVIKSREITEFKYISILMLYSIYSCDRFFFK